MPGHNDPWIQPIVRKPDWRKLGACRGQDPNTYIPEKRDKKDTKHYDKSICDSCVVKPDCLDFALANRAKKGLWGGTVPKERDKMYRWYLGEREHELDLEYILFGRQHGNADLPPTDYSTEDAFDIICDPLALNDPLYLSWIPPVFIQGTLFSNEEYWYIDSSNTRLVSRTKIKSERQRIAMIGYMQESLFDL